MYVLYVFVFRYDVNKKIKAYEKEKARLAKVAAGTGVKAKGAGNLLAQMESGPMAEELRAALIHAEAKVRLVAKAFGIKIAKVNPETGEEEAPRDRTRGSVWWLKREIKEKKKLYGPKGNAGGKKKKKN